ncbi:MULTISPECIES: hypothetical protein [unclassified Amycolatopsis]|uniref:hypothetical protein n=1 Tax=unclassified Amycolatopsis TaxID=2618356 RepID=UPI001C6967D9|nr:hypothetical protein [Amycolatopsis sp. DSM 110486]QYN19236.1 hypothetical protein K1T34_42460 [Amycolatopsis sp. DSM 110486]
MRRRVVLAQVATRTRPTPGRRCVDREGFVEQSRDVHALAVGRRVTGRALLGAEYEPPQLVRPERRPHERQRHRPLGQPRLQDDNVRLLLVFAPSMALSLGWEAPLSASVFAAAAALLMAVSPKAPSASTTTTTWRSRTPLRT